MPPDFDSNTNTVLIVSADSEFAAGCEHNLPKYLDMQVRTTATVGAAIDILSNHDRIDCVVSDHNLPDTDGVSFLEVVRARSPSLPFILFTSEGSEEFASRAISAGVTEYLIKEHHANQWERLSRLITDAVNYYHNHGDIVNTETRAKTLLDATRDMIAVIRDGSFEYINQTGVELLRATSRSAVVDHSVDDILSTDDTDSLADQLIAIEGGDKLFLQTEQRLIRNDGTSIPVEVTASHGAWMGVPSATLVVRDISERKEYETELELKERAMHNAPVGITIADARKADNPLIYANEEFQRLTGYSPDEALGQNCRFLQGEDTNPEPVAEMRDAIDADEPVTVELRNYRKDGTEFWNRVTISPVEDDTGDVTHYVGFQEDVTERKEYEHALQRFRRAVEAAGYAIYMTDADGTIQYVNPAFEQITGFSSDEAVGQKPRILKSGEMATEYYEELWETVLDGAVWNEEIINARKCGERYHARQTIAPVTDEGRDITSFVAIQTDITEVKERETQLQWYKRAVDGTNELIVAIDNDHKLLFANPAYCEFYNIDQEDVAGLSLPEVVGPDTFETIKPYVKQALAGHSARYRMTRTRPDRPNRTFDIRYYSLEDEAGNVQGGVATMHDLTTQLERENQLASLDRMLRHNLHNELNIILGRAEMIANQASGEIAEQATTIERAADRILNQTDKEREIIEFLTDISQPETLNVGKTVREIAHRVRMNYPTIEITIEGAENVHVRTIPEIERAIEELVENAVIHNDAEHPEIAISIEADNETVGLSVSDNGPGIPPAEQKVIGEDAPIEPLLHSEGMGLWLVKRIVTQADGTLTFKDADQRGSTAIIVIPRGVDPVPDGVTGEILQDE